MQATATEPVVESLPEILQLQQRWIRWTMSPGLNGKLSKRPNRSTSHPEQWSRLHSIDTSVSAEAGVGFVTGGQICVDDENGRTWIVGLDLDACVAPDGTISPWAAEIVERCHKTFTALSPSGTGLHVWLRLDVKPQIARALIKLDVEKPANCTKQPQLQVFGHGPSNYMTMTGRRLLECANDILDCTDAWKWIVEKFGLGHEEQAQVRMPEGYGEPPTHEAITEDLRGRKNGPELIAGEWWKVLDPQKQSASEAFHMLTLMALRAANNHGEVVVHWLLRCTMWGQGKIEHSLDPGKYQRAAWVRKDVARAAKHAPMTPQQAFTVIDPSNLPGIDTREKPKRLRYAPVSELWDTVGKDPFLVEGVLPRQGLARIFGDPGCGKTPVALSLAIAVATGEKTWMGHEVDQHGPVFYMVGEDRDGLINRCRAEAKRTGRTKEDFASLQMTLQPGQLLDADDVNRWIDEILLFAPNGIPLLVVDTQSRNFNGDENSSKDMALFVHHLTAISERLRCLVLLVHHNGLQAKERARGSNVALGGLDAELSVEHSGMEVTVHSRKEKNWGKPDPLHGVLVPLEVGTDVRGRAITAVALEQRRRTQEERLADLKLDADFDELGWQLLNWIADHQGEEASRGRIAGALGVDDGTVLRDHIKELETKLQVITSTKEGQTKPLKFQLTEKGVRYVASRRAEAGQNPANQAEPAFDLSILE